MNKELLAGYILTWCFVFGWYWVLGPLGIMIGFSLVLHYVAIKEGL